MKMPCVFLVLLLYAVSSNGQVQNFGNLKMHPGSEIGLFGNFSNDGNFNDNSGTLHTVGPNHQIFGGANAIHTDHFTMNKSGNSLKLDNVLQVGGTLTFINGSILTDRDDIATAYVEFSDGASYTGASGRSHIDGAVRKTGNDAFVFPTGANFMLRTIGISAPASETDHFTACYVEENPDGLYSRTALGDDLNHVSACEYWILDRTGGSSNVAVTLSWALNSCGVDHLCDLRVARWDGIQWTSSGNGGTTGTTESGTLVSGGGCSEPDAVKDFSPFTLGSSSNFNPLPISLISFEASVCESSVCLNWKTASEVNNDFFTVEKSENGFTWQDLIEVAGAGDSQTVLDYKTVDKSPFAGHSYYRLKQTDFDGAFTYSPIESVFLKSIDDKGLTLYPNPTRDHITIAGLSAEANHIKIFNTSGQEVMSFKSATRDNMTTLRLDISHLTPGIYLLKANNGSGTIVKQ